MKNEVLVNASMKFVIDLTEVLPLSAIFFYRLVLEANQKSLYLNVLNAI